MRELIIKRVGFKYKSEKIKDIYSEGAINTIRKHFNTKDVVYCYGSLLHGSSNMPMVFIVTKDNEQFEVHVWEK